MNGQDKKWEVIHKSKTKDITSVLLKNRGIKSKAQKKEFLHPVPPANITLKALGISPESVSKAVARIKKARDTQEKVIVYGDYDADGICATAIMWESLNCLGINVLPYIPERFSEGYGLNIESIKSLKKEDPKLGLIITVDHGIVADTKVDLAREMGIDVIITDHHMPGKIKPKALAIIHSTKISGAAVSWVLAQFLQGRTLTKVRPLELVAIGTIADQLPLVGPNRSFAKFGLKELNRTTRVGLLSLFKEAGIVRGAIGPYEVGFLLAPRINSMGRMTHAIESLRLLCTKSRSRGEEIALLMGKTNTERQKVVDEVVVHAKASLGKTVRDSVLVVAHETYHEGVIGLAAARLVEEYYRPTIILSKKESVSKASARSIAGFNIVEAIRNLSGLYIEGGGHPMAAGFSIQTENIDIFRKKINKLSKKLLTADILTRRIKIDTEIAFNQITWGLYNIIASFEPTGLGNPAPTFATKKVNVIEARAVGKEGKHLKLKVEQDGIVLDAIAFGSGPKLAKLVPNAKIDIAYTLEQDTWNGNQKLQLKIKDMKVN